MDSDPRSAVRIGTDALDHFTKLLRSEMAVARAEFGEKVSEAIAGSAFLVVAGLLLIPVVVVALLALAAWLTELGLRGSLAHGAAALAGLVLVAGLALIGKGKLSPPHLTPTHTLSEMKKDSEAASRVV